MIMSAGPVPGFGILKKPGNRLHYGNIEIALMFPEQFEGQVLAADKWPQVPGQLGTYKGKNNNPDFKNL